MTLLQLASWRRDAAPDAAGRRSASPRSSPGVPDLSNLGLPKSYRNRRRAPHRRRHFFHCRGLCHHRRKPSRNCSPFVLTLGTAGVCARRGGASVGATAPVAAAAVGPSPRSARASSRVLMPAPTRICSVCACSSGSTASSPTHTNSRPRLVHALLDHMVERALHPRFQRHQPLLRRLLAQGLARRPVDLGDEGGSRDREGVADDARQPLVILVLQRRLSRFDQLEVGGHEFGLASARQVAAHQRVEIVLERADLVGRPFPGQSGEGVRASILLGERKSKTIYKGRIYIYLAVININFVFVCFIKLQIL